MKWTTTQLLKQHKVRSCGCIFREYVENQKVPVKLRFWDKVDKNSGLGPKGTCWEWTSSKTSSGHGNVRDDLGRTTVAHRVSWELCRGDIPAGLQVLHSCDNPPCVNPDHLWLGTNLENMQDKVKKGRCGKAWTDPRERWGEEVQRKIYLLTKTGLLSVRQMAKAFDLSDQTIRLAAEIYNQKAEHSIT